MARGKDQEIDMDEWMMRAHMLESSRYGECAVCIYVCMSHSHFKWQLLKPCRLIKLLFAVDTAAEQKLSECVTDALGWVEVFVCLIL